MNYDVIVIGGGMVGQTIALGLAQTESARPLRIALLDPAATAAPTRGSGIADYDVRVSALTAQSQRLFESLGIWSSIPSNRISPYHGMVVWDAEGTGRVQFDAADLHVQELGHIVENNETVWALQQALQTTHVDRLSQRMRYVDHPNAEGLTPVALDDGRVLQAALVIACDGAHSYVRQCVGFRTREWDYQHHAIVATVRCEKSLQHTAWQRFRPQGPLAFLPLAGDEHLASIVWSTSPHEAATLMSMMDDAFCSALADAFEHQLGSILDCSTRSVVPLRQRHATRYVMPGVALAGDAAHTIHPLAGQGVNLGLKDAAALIEEIQRAWGKRLPLGELRTLERYQRRRQADNLATMVAMEGFKRLFETEQPLLRLLRNQGMRWFDRALPLKQHVMMRAMGLDTTVKAFQISASD